MAQIAAHKCDFSCNGVALFYCKGCSQGLCVKCRQNVHDKVQLFKDHEVVIIEKEGNLAFRPQPVCDTHKKTFICYCSRCDCLTCAECMTDNHNEHKTESIKKIADVRRENVTQIIEKLKSKVDKVEQNLATIETKHYCRIKSDCESYVKRVEETTDELHKIIDRHKLIPITTASDFQYNENEVLDQKTAFFKQRYNEIANRLLKFENLLQETHDSSFLTEWKTLQTDVQIIYEENDDPLWDPSGIEMFNQELFTKSVIEDMDEEFAMKMKELEKTVSSLTNDICVLKKELRVKQEQIDDLSKMSRLLEEKTKKVRDLLEENENLEKEKNEGKQKELSKMKEHEQTVASLTDDIGVLKGDLKVKQEEINDLSKLSLQVKEKENKVTELMDENDKLKTEVSERHQKECSKLSLQLKEKENKVTELMDENDKLKTEVSERHQKECSKLSLQLKEKENKVTELMDENDKLKTEVSERHQKECSKLSLQLKEKENKVTELMDENDKLKTEVSERHQKECSKLSLQLKEKENKVTELMDKNNKLKTEVSERHQKESSKLKEKENKVDELQGENAKLKADIIYNNGEIKRLKEGEKKVNILQEDNAKLKDDVKHKQDKIGILSGLLHGLKENAKIVTELLDENEKQKTELKQRKKKELLQLNEREKIFSELQEENSKLKYDIKFMQDEVDKLSKFKEKEKEVNELQEDNAKLKADVLYKQVEIEKISKLLQGLNENEKIVTDLLDMNEKQKTELKQRDMKEFLLLKEKERKIKELQAENSKLKAEIQSKQEEVEQLSKKSQDIPHEDTPRSCNPKGQYRDKKKPQGVEPRLAEIQAGKPEKPYVTEEMTKSNQIILKWEHKEELKDGQFYQIVMKQHPLGKWEALKTHKPCIRRFLKVDCLRANTSYVFKVHVENNATGEKGPCSPESEVIVTGESISPALRIMKRSEKIKDGIPSIFKLPVQEILQARNEESLTRKFILGTPNNHTKEKTIMIVGATGSGKSTLIDGMANYVMGVTWEDTFRFSLINELKHSGNQTLSHTEWITCYTIFSDVSSRIDYTLNIIDTPGFGDTRGVEQDVKIVSQIRDLFTANDERGIASLDALCFLVQAPNSRLTCTQKYIFQFILALFGNDIRNNICTLVTYSDGQRPPVLSALEALEDKTLPFDVYYSFNNIVLYANNSETFQKSISSFFWEMGMKSYNNFFQSLIRLQTKSLLLSSEVLTKRENLKTTMLQLHEEIGLGLSQIGVLEHEVHVFTKYKRELHDKSFEKDKYEQVYQKKISQECVLNKIQKKIEEIKAQLQLKLEEIDKYSNRLKEIALCPNPLISVESIAIVIKEEMLNRKSGYNQRVKSLEQYIKIANIRETYQNFEDQLRNTRTAM